VHPASAIRLPLTAILNKDGHSLVWVVDDQTAQVSPRAVQLGSAHDDQVLVTAGLASGERVVTAGVHMLVAGQRVKPAGATEVAMKGPQP